MIEEKLAVLAHGQQWDVGEPSKLQRAMIERLEKIMIASNADLKRRIRESKRNGSETNPPIYPASKNDRTARMTMRGAELLQAMHGCDELGVAILLLKYAQDRSATSRILELLEREAIQLHIRNKWKSYKGRDVIRSMCRLALAELDDPKCKTCGGGGYGPKGARCQTCDATGALKIEDKDRAIALCVRPDAFRKTYKQRLNAIIEIARTKIDRAKTRICRNMYG